MICQSRLTIDLLTEVDRAIALLFCVLFECCQWAATVTAMQTDCKTGTWEGKKFTYAKRGGGYNIAD